MSRSHAAAIAATVATAVDRPLADEQRFLKLINCSPVFVQEDDGRPIWAARAAACARAEWSRVDVLRDGQRCERPLLRPACSRQFAF